ncbi:hypothetical protein M3172_06050 [Mesobacillus subterraneus]|uniref:hypothetical protein n=1 Tax=Mesobacillus subterraneus TaxID=285983 RepID=UPI00203A862F|nr:hypothetical protein [Mesobacillus subterraneus]MCM3572746.1 hypothetical protein [Mesobacillus subterraneus]
MTTFLLLLSLMLNVAAIFAIILLYLRQNRLAEAEKKQGKIIKEIEEVFSAYLFELKEENDKFLELMSATNIQKESDGNKTAPIEAAEEKPEAVADGVSKETNQRLGKGISYHAARKAYQQNHVPVPSDSNDNIYMEIPEDNSESTPLSFVDQVVHMKKQGLTIEEIARDLDKGKTEIELLLKFRQNTQE